MTIRLLDPPLHEFLPKGNIEEIVGELVAETGAKEDEVFSRVEKLSEVNPMLGFRGCRLDSKLTLLSRGLKFMPASDIVLVIEYFPFSLVLQLHETYDLLVYIYYLNNNH